jgi:hypothetical protein
MAQMLPSADQPVMDLENFGKVELTMYVKHALIRSALSVTTLLETARLVKRTSLYFLGWMLQPLHSVDLIVTVQDNTGKVELTTYVEHAQIQNAPIVNLTLLYFLELISIPLLCVDLTAMALNNTGKEGLTIFVEHAKLIVILATMLLDIAILVKTVMTC